MTRAGIFWETCGIDGSGKVYGRDGWNILVKNMGDKDTGAIKNGKLTVRLKKDGFSDISGGNGAHFYGDDDKIPEHTPIVQCGFGHKAIHRRPVSGLSQRQ